jgi:hypothetical protein
MSRIEFMTRTELAEVWGGERMVFDGITTYMVENRIKNKLSTPKQIKKLIKEYPEYIKKVLDSYGDDEELSEFDQRTLMLHLKLSFSDNPPLIYDEVVDEYVPGWCFALNEAMRLGSDAVKFMARIHGQSECHTYVKKENYLWLRDIIQKGLDDKIITDDIRGNEKGWKRVIKLLETSKEDVIVTSYTVTDGFPDPYWVGVKSDEERDAFKKKPFEEQFDLCLPELYKINGLEMKPGDWDTIYFGFEY